MSQNIEAGEIEKIKAHLTNGGRVIVRSHTRPLLLNKKHIDYIRADGNGYRLGWPGRSSVFAFPSHLGLIA